MIYKFRFSARRKDAIGIFSVFEAERSAANVSEATALLYDEFEHIHLPEVVSVREEVEFG